MVNTRKFSEFANKGVQVEGQEVVGLDDGVNSRYLTAPQLLPPGDTASRPALPVASMIRYNTDFNKYEFYNGTEWEQLADSEDLTNLIARLAAHTPDDGAGMIGLQNQAGVTNQTVQDMANASFLAQTDNGSLANAQFMAALATGITKNATTTGVQSVLTGSGAIDAVINDDTMASAATTNISTALAVKNYVDGLDAGNVKSVTGTANQITVDNTDAANPVISISDNPIISGTAGISIPTGTTAERVVPTAPNINLRFNTDTETLEYYDHVDEEWAQLPSELSGTYLEIAGGTMAGDIDMDGNRIVGLPTPTDDDEAATKGYVDDFAQGLVIKQAVIATSTANYVSIYDNGTAGVGATLTNDDTQAAFEADGETLTVGQRVLIKDQTATEHNGIYEVTVEGDGTTNWVLTRTTDFDEPDNIVAGSLIPVLDGATNNGTKWVQTQDVDVVGTDSILFVLWMINADRVVTTDTAQTITGEKTFDDAILGNDLDANNNKIVNLLNPTNPQDAATKDYVDTFAEGLTVKTAVQAASTTAYTAVYDNGTAGVGATLTNDDTQAAFELDDITPSVGQRVLIKDQADSAHNGIYTVTDAGSGATNWVLTRSTDFDEPSNIVAGSLVPVLNGTVNGGTKWVQTENVNTVGTDDIDFIVCMISADRIVTTDTNKTITGEKTFTAPMVAESIEFDPSTGGIIGTTTNNNAGAGYVGEIVSSVIAAGAPISLTSTTAANVTSISLTAGDWDVWGEVRITGTATSLAGARGAVNTTSATLPATGVASRESAEVAAGAPASVGGRVLSISNARISIASTTTVYLIAQAGFSGGTAVAQGTIVARRAR